MLLVEECATMQKQAAIYNRRHISHTPLALSPSTPSEECPLSQVRLLATVAVSMYRFDMLNMHLTFHPYEGCLSQLG